MSNSDPHNAARRSTSARIALALIAAGLAGGCGQKGPLRLPEPLPPPASAAQPEPAASAAVAPNAASSASAPR